MVAVAASNAKNHIYMETLDFNFVSDAANRFPTVDEDGKQLLVAIDRAMGVLRITVPGEQPQEFPLTQDDDPFPQAVLITQNEDLGTMIEVGTVDFMDQAEYLEDYPLNDPKIMDVWNLNLEDGGICILDIRNLGRWISTIYSLEVMPVALSITGIYLRVATLKYFADSGLTPWYQQVSIPKP